MQGNKKICVLGSANADHFLYVNKIPAVGETIQSHKYFTANGGKGANQAVSVGKLAGFSYFLGQVGNDDAMHRLQKEMKSGNVDLRWKVIEEHHTGMAYIYVDSKGENSIVIFGGTNMEFENKDDIDDDFKKVIDQSHYLLLQKEIPMSINLAAAKYAHSQSKIVILDCGGRDDDIPEELLDNITYISPNETELLRLDETIIGRTELEPLAEEIRKKLIERHPNLRVLLKLGSKGSAVITKDVVVRGDVVTSINKDILNDYKIIDTVGAGDCFTGAYAVRHSELNWSDISLQERISNYRDAMEFGNSSAFLCITKNGAMPSMPHRKEVDEFIKKYGIQ